MILNKLDFLCDSYVSTMLSLGKWVDHGTDLNQWLDECEIERSQIDIKATMESRMDYIHGDYEMEIQIKSGEKVKLINFSLV